MNFRKHKRDRNLDLDDEIASHFRMALRDRMDRGESYETALAAVRREFGNEPLVKETTRGMWSGVWADTLLTDLRFALRRIRKSPVWAAAVVISLAFGVGANTAIFSLTYAIILKSLPVPEPSRLIRYGFRNGDQDIGLSGPSFDALRRHQTVCSGLLAWSDAEFSLDENGQTERVKAGLLSGSGFGVLRLDPMLGTAFGETDDVPGGGPRGYQALLSNAWWKSHFHSDPSIIGRTLRLNGRAVTIAGILPPGFEGLMAGSAASIILPLAFEEVSNSPNSMRNSSGSFWLSVFGRLLPGQSLTSAAANLSAIEPAVREEADPKHTMMNGFFKPFRFTVASGSGGRSFLRGLYERPLMILEMLAALVLVLCCANTALLVLAQMSGRAQQFALCAALGAPRGRLIRHVLLEILALASIGLVLAIALGWGLARSLAAMLAGVSFAPSVDVAPNGAILAFTALLTLAASLGCGLFAAFRASRNDPAAALKQGRGAIGGGHARHAAGRWIVPAQVAVSVTLVTSALLLGAGFLQLSLNHAGFEPNGLVLADLDLQAAKLTAPQLEQARRQIVSALASAPGVEAAAFLSAPPIHDWWSASHYFSINPSGGVYTDMNIWPEVVSSRYFTAMGTRLLEGEAFRADASSKDRTCILSENAAAYFFPGDDALGRLLYSGGSDPHSDGTHLDPADACRVIGVVEDVPFRSLREAPPRMVYRPVGESDDGTRFSIAVRASNTAAVAAEMREIVHQAAPVAPPPAVYSFARLLDTHLSKERMLIRLSVCFGGCALLLTAVGLYGLLMRTVQLRTREIGIRMALGGSRRSAVTAVLGTASRHLALGLAVGGVMAYAAVRAMSSLVYGVSPGDPRIYGGAILVLLLTAALAAFIPARRAAAVDPAEALRAE